MPTHVAFLRAINVTGRFVKMAELVSHFRSLGYSDATNFINTGNVVFSACARSLRKLELSIQAGLEPLLGFRSEVFVRTTTELRTISDRATSLRQQLADGGEVNVCFLQSPPSAEQMMSVAAMENENDRFVFDALHVYWLSQVSQSQSKFSNGVLERKLKARSTLRRQSTLAELLARLGRE